MSKQSEKKAKRLYKLLRESAAGEEIKEFIESRMLELEADLNNGTHLEEALYFAGEYIKFEEVLNLISIEKAGIK